MKRLGLAVFAALTMLPALAFAAGDLPYLFDQMKVPNYGATLTALFDGDRATPSWFKGFLKRGDGVATPGKSVTSGGKPYELYGVCQPHNCGGNFVYVLFTPGGGEAWALSMANGAHFHYYGHPSTAQRKTLQSAGHILD